MKVTFDGEVIDKAATLVCTPAWRQGWCTLHFVNVSGRDCFQSMNRDVRVEEIDGRLYASGGWGVQVVQWTDTDDDAK